MQSELLEVSESLRRAFKIRKKTIHPALIAMRTALQVYAPESDALSKKSYALLMQFKSEYSGTFLDVGCYGGWMYPHIKDWTDYHGIDVWPEAIDVATRMFGEHFEVANYETYTKQHDIVWCSQLAPEHLCGKDGIQKLLSLARKMLIYSGQDIRGDNTLLLEGFSEKGEGWVVFRK